MADMLDDALPPTSDQHDGLYSDSSDDGFTFVVPTRNMFQGASNSVDPRSMPTTTKKSKPTSNILAVSQTCTCSQKTPQSPPQTAAVQLLQDQLDSIMSEVNAKNLELVDVTRRMNSLNEEVNAKAVDLEASTKEIKRLQDIMEIKNFDLNDAVKKTEQAENTVKSMTQTHADNLITLWGQFEIERKTSSKLLKDARDSANSQYQAAMLEIEELREVDSQLKDALKAAEAAVASYHTTISSLTTRIGEYDTTAAKKEESLKRCYAELKFQELELEKRRKKNTEMEKICESLRSELQQALTNSSVTSKIHASPEYRELSAKLEDIRRAYERTLEDVHLNAEAAKNQCVEAEQEFFRLKSKYDGTALRLTQVRSSNIRYSLKYEKILTAMSAIESKLALSSDNLVAAENRESILKARIEGLDEKVSTLQTDIRIKAPLVEIGAAIRLRFLQYGSEVVYSIRRNEIGSALVNGGNRAAHRGNFVADAALFEAELVPESSMDESTSIFEYLYDFKVEDVQSMCHTLAVQRFKNCEATVATLKPTEKSRDSSTQQIELDSVIQLLNAHWGLVPDGGTFEIDDEIESLLVKAEKLCDKIVQLSQGTRVRSRRNNRRNDVEVDDNLDENQIPDYELQAYDQYYTRGEWGIGEIPDAGGNWATAGENNDPVDISDSGYRLEDLILPVSKSRRRQRRKTKMTLNVEKW